MLHSGSLSPGFFLLKPVYLFNNVLICVTTAVSEDPQRPAFYFLCVLTMMLSVVMWQSEFIFPRIK